MDRAAEFELYREEIARKVRRRYSRLAVVDDVEDLVSEAWVSAWKALSASRHPNRRRVALNAALWGVADYLAADAGALKLKRHSGQRCAGYRERLTRFSEVEEWRIESISQPDFAPEVVARLSAAEIARWARHQVNASQWRCLQLTVMEERTSREASLVCRWSENYITWCRGLALRKIRAALNEEAENG